MHIFDKNDKITKVLCLRIINWGNLNIVAKKSKLSPNYFNSFELVVVIGLALLVIIVTFSIIIIKVQKQNIIQQTKKTYALLSQAVRSSSFDNGSVFVWYEDATRNSDNFYDMFLKSYLNTSKPCYDYRDCGYKMEKPWNSPNGEVYNFSLNNAGNQKKYFHLRDGVFVVVKTVKQNENGENKEPTIIYDINGEDGPNVLGKDVFTLLLHEEKGTTPFCAKQNDLSYVKNNCSKNGEGSCCLFKLMNDSWHFKSGYPI